MHVQEFVVHNMGKFTKSKLLYLKVYLLWPVPQTVTMSVCDEMITLLDMKGCEVVSTSHNRPNIYYGVKPRTEITLDMLPLLNYLKEHRNTAPRVIVYCLSLNIVQTFTLLSIFN